MPEYVAPKRLYHDATRSRVVEEGDPDAAFLLVGQGTILTEAEAQQYAGLDKYLKEYKAPDPLKVEQERLKAALEGGHLGEAASRQNTVDQLQAERSGEVPAAVPMVSEEPAKADAPIKADADEAPRAGRARTVKAKDD